MYIIIETWLGYAVQLYPREPVNSGGKGLIPELFKVQFPWNYNVTHRSVWKRKKLIAGWVGVGFGFLLSLRIVSSQSIIS